MDDYSVLKGGLESGEEIKSRPIKTMINQIEEKIDKAARENREIDRESWDLQVEKKKDRKEFHGSFILNIIRDDIQFLIRYTLNQKDVHNTILNACAIFFIAIYVCVTAGWLYLFTNPSLGMVIDWNYYVSIMLLTAVIHVWIYAFLKNIRSIDTLNDLYKGEKNSYHVKILPDAKNLIWPFPWTKGCSVVEVVIKALFTILWGVVSYVILFSCSKLKLFDPATNNYIGIYVAMASKVLLKIGLILNYVSYYSSVAFCFFTREIANAEDLECDTRIPWNSKYLRDLLHVSSRSSMSFFAVSMMYLLAVVVCIMPGDRFKDIENFKNYLIPLLSATVFLCVVSFIIVSFLPKVFLNRLFRKWKYHAIEELEKDTQTEEQRRINDSSISTIWSSNLPYVRMEVASALLAFGIDVASLVIGIFKLVEW